MFFFIWVLWVFLGFSGFFGVLLGFSGFGLPPPKPTHKDLGD